MRPFCRLFAELDRSEGNLARVSALARHLQSAEPADAAWTLQLLLGKQRRRLITARQLRLQAQRITSLPPWLLEACHAQVGDSAETIALLVGSGRQGPVPPRDQRLGSVDEAPPGHHPADWPLHRWMEEELPRLAALEEEAQAAALAEHWRCLEPEEILVLNKLLTGAFRVGVGPALVVKALARCSGLEENLLQHRLMGEWRPSAAAWAALIAPPQEGVQPPGRPYPFQLACALPTGTLPKGEPHGWLAEWKWDGIRGQLIRRGGESFLWSRGEELLNAAFPELLDLGAHLPEGTVLDGEVLIWAPGEDRPRPFAQLQRRIGQRSPTARLLRDCPVSYVVYDLLEADGDDRRSLPLLARRERLEGLLAGLRELPGLRLSQPLALQRWEDLERWRQAAREAGAEGLMLKAGGSAYGSGRRRGIWWKHKLEPLHLDAVLLYARNGSGRRANLYTDYTFGLWSAEADSATISSEAAEARASAAEPLTATGEMADPASGGRRLVSFASAYSGLSDAEILELDRWIRRHTSERFGPVRAVQPELVFELAFEGVQRSRRHRSGVAVRFPRIRRWRRDKPAAEADTLAAALALIPP